MFRACITVGVTGLLSLAALVAEAHQSINAQPISSPIEDRGNVSYIQLPCSSGSTTLPCTNGSTHELSFSKDGKALWITQMTANRVLRYDVKNKQIVQRSLKMLPMPSQPHGLIAESSTTAWITLEPISALAQIDSNGNILKQINLAAGTGPHGLDIAPDGTLWFAGKEGSVVGSANPKTGVINYYPLAANSQSIYIHVAKNGDVWFTELTGSKIGRIRKGVMTEITLPFPDARPISIETDPRGGVYFTQEAANSLGYINPSIAKGPASGLLTSTIVQYEVPAVGAKPAGGTITPSGEVWFGCFAIDQLVKLNKPKQMVYEYTQGTTGLGWHRTAHSQGIIWWTELSADQIGRFLPTP